MAFASSTTIATATGARTCAANMAATPSRPAPPVARSFRRIFSRASCSSGRASRPRRRTSGRWRSSRGGCSPTSSAARTAISASSSISPAASSRLLLPGERMRGSWRKVRFALNLSPRRAWRFLAFEAAWSLPLAAGLCAFGGLADFGWTDDPDLLLRLALVALVAPAFGEELLFRVLLLPPPGDPAKIRRILLSAALFVLWHPPQVWLFGAHWGEVVLNPYFLAAVAVMGVALARLYVGTGSIWPCVLLHWVTVVGWKAWFGAPSPWIAA